MSNLIGVRLNKEDHDEYLKIVKENGTNPSAMTAKIVHDWLRFQRIKQYRGDITLSGEILKKRHDAIKRNDLAKIVIHNAKVIISEMEFQWNLSFFCLVLSNHFKTK